MYTLKWTAGTWLDTDGGTHFKMYGKLAVDIGQRPQHQGVILWELPPEGYQEVKLGTTKIFSSSVNFQESKDFQKNGLVILHGKTMEFDERNIQTIGDYEGETYTAEMLLNGLTLNYQESRGGRVTINMELTYVD